MNYNSLFTAFFILLISSSLIILPGCEKKTIHPYNFNTDSFHKYEEAVQERSFEKLFQLLDDENPDVRNLAWLAISRSLPTDIDLLFSRVLEETDPEPWIALTVRNLDSGKWEQIYERWENDKAYRPAICNLMGRVGGKDAVDLLLSDIEFLKNSYECTYAIGRITSRQQISMDSASEMLSLAFETDELEIRRNLLYGFYRGRLLSLERQYRTSLKIVEQWLKTIGDYPEIDRMMMGIYGETAMDPVSAKWVQGGYSNDHLTLIEMVRIMFERELHQTAPTELYVKLLETGNHHVQHITLDVLQRIPAIDPELTEWISKNITSFTRNAEIFIKTLELLRKENADIRPFQKKLEFYASDSPLFLGRVLPLLNEYYSVDEYRDFLFGKLSENKIAASIAIGGIIELWRNGRLNADDTTKLQQIVINAVENNRPHLVRPSEVALTEFDLLDDDEMWRLYEVIRSNDYEQWHELYHSFVRVMSVRFDEEFRDEISNLRELNRYRLHMLLNQFDENRPQFEGNRFKSVNWGRLTELGSKPHWTLKTERGTIVIELDPLTAPFTVSAIDEYTRSGVYNNVPFHRVVSNFVIQGGDFSLQNGSGSTPQVLPTEPTARSFEKGMAGVASSGIDTEGSQYFFMIQWGPHLDGDYTIFGRVVRGMDAVQKIRAGDRVLSAEIAPR